MSIEPREEIKILQSIADSLKDISLYLKDIRDDISDLNVEGLVKLIDIVAEQQEIQKLVKHRVKSSEARGEEKDELVNDLVKIFITGGFKKCEICHKYKFISNVYKDSICDTCRDKYLKKGLSKEEAKKLERANHTSDNEKSEK